MRRPLAAAGVTAALGFVALSALDALRAAPPQFGTNVVIVDASDPALPKQAGVDGSGNLKINCIAGCSAGSGTGANNADGIAAVGTGLGASVGYNYLWNGASWDRQPGSAANGASVNLGKYAGVTPDMNAGAAGANTPRVVLANNSSTNVAQMNGVAVSVGAGASGTGTQRVVLSSDSALAANQSVNNAQVSGNAVAVGNGPSGTGVQRVTIASDSTGQVTVMPAAATTGGATPYHLSGGTTASTNSTNIKSSAGTIYTLVAINTSATVGYLKVYNLSSAPTCSSATGIVHVYPVPAGTNGAGFVIPISAMGEAYSTGIGFCVTGGGTDTDNTSGPAGIFIEASYK